MIAKIKSIGDIIEQAEPCKSDARRDARIFSHYKRRLLALADGKPLRWVCVQYLCGFPGLSPYDMGAELMAEGVKLIYNNTAVSRAVNRAEQQKVQRACTARENVRM